MAIEGTSPYGWAGGYLNTPSPKTEYNIAYDRLDGGLNIYELEYRLKANESPEMRNLLWRDGALGCRDGQEWLSEEPLGIGYAMYSGLFEGHLFAHIGTRIYHGDPEAFTPVSIFENVPTVRGTFFRYGDHLFYKTKGAYIQISHSGGAFTAEPVSGYVPTTYINCHAGNGSGDKYQPENRIQPQKRMEYNAEAGIQTFEGAGDGAATVFTLPVDSESQARLAKVGPVYIGANEVAEHMYTVNLTAGTVTFATAPEANARVTVVYYSCVFKYYLPITPDSVDEIKVDGAVLTAGTDYTVSGAEITFTKAPPVTTPPQNNTVRITYTKANPEGMSSIMDCVYAIVYGSGSDVCVVMAGSEAQPNAYFWSGHHIVFDPGYFPFEQYNLGGDTEEAITGFGKQQNYLIIFKRHSIGRTTMGTTEIGDRHLIDLPFVRINDDVGCDLPWTIQLVENNLVWCNSIQGAHILSDTTAAYENNVTCISLKVNGSESSETMASPRNGLLADLRHGGGVCSLDDGTRYWVVANGHAYVWDYELSPAREPSWFFFTNIHAVAWAFTDRHNAYHLNASGQITEMVRSFSDYPHDETENGVTRRVGAIEKYYRFPAQNFNNYDVYKNVTSVIFVVRSDTDSLISITYHSDWEERQDLTDILAYKWRLCPRNLAYRFLGVPKYAVIARRRPGCRNIRHFAMSLSNNMPDNDLSVIKAQVFYKMQGRQR